MTKKNEDLAKTKNGTEEPIVWTKKNGPLENFLQVCKGLGFHYILYTQDAGSGEKMVWGTHKLDLVDTLLMLGDKAYFSRMQTIENAINFGFDHRPAMN